MIALLIAAVGGIALVAATGAAISRSRDRQRRDQQERSAAAAQARASARAAEDRRRALAGVDDELTSVIPAIRLPWPTKLTAPRGPGYPGSGTPGGPGLDGEYPRFATLTPFQAAPCDAPPGVVAPGGAVPHDYGAAGHQAVPDGVSPAGHDRFALPGTFVPAPTPEPAPMPEPALMPEPAPMPDACGLPDHRARGRAAHGSHRAGHARRRRG